MKKKRIFAFAIALALVLGSMGIMACAEDSGSEPTSTVDVNTVTSSPTKEAEPSVSDGTGDSNAESTLPPETEVSETVIPGMNLSGEGETSEQSPAPETPSIEPMVNAEQSPDPTEEVSVEQRTDSPYGIVPYGTVLYKDSARNEKLGELTDETVMLLNEIASYESGSLYETWFDTKESLQNEESEHAYFFSANVEILTSQQAEDRLFDKGTHRIDGNSVLMAKVEYEAIPEQENADAPKGDLNQSHVNGEIVNMRSEPSSESQRIAQLQYGENVEVTGSAINADGETWYAVVYRETEGYIRSDLVNVIGDVPQAGDSTAEQEQRAKTVCVDMNLNTQSLQIGSQITLSARLEGFDGLDYTGRWQYAPADSEGNIIGEWQDSEIESLSFTYELTEENLLTAWRMCVTVNE